MATTTGKWLINLVPRVMGHYFTTGFYREESIKRAGILPVWESHPDMKVGDVVYDQDVVCICIQDVYGPTDSKREQQSRRANVGVNIEAIAQKAVENGITEIQILDTVAIDDLDYYKRLMAETLAEYQIKLSC